MRKNVVGGDLYGKIQVNVRNTTSESSLQESCISMKASIQHLIQEFKAVVFEKDDLEFRDVSEIEALLPLLAYQDSNSDVEIIF